MSSPFSNLIYVVDEFQSETDKLLLRLFKDREELAIRLNVDSQLYDKGIDSEGELLTPPYAESTKRKKRKKGHPTDRVTTRDENVFHKSIVFEYRRNEVEFDSDDPKARYLFDRYGKFILGLAPESIAIMSEDLKDDFLNEARKIIIG